MESAKLELQQGQDSGNGNVVTRLDGKLSLETVNSFLQTMRQEPAKHLVLDMSGVSFLDSSGVGALVSLFVTRKHTGKDIGAGEFDEAGDRSVASVGVAEIDPHVSHGGSGGQRARVSLAGRPGGMAGEQAIDQADVVTDK